MVGLSEQEIFATTGPEHTAYKFVAILSTALILLAIGFNAYREHHLAGTRSALKAQNLRFDAALNNMSHGLCMYDGNERLLVCNERYAEIYRLPPRLLKEGTPLRDIVRYRILHGIVKGETSEAAAQAKFLSIATLPADKRSRRIEELADGSLISITRDPMAGGGWVATHEDITEQTRAQRELDRTKRFLDLVIEKLPLPVVVKDPATSKFLLVNQAYEAFIGLTRDKIIGGSTCELFSREDTERMTKYDMEALQSNERVINADLEVKTPFGGTRVCATTRLVVRDSNDQPQYLIIVIEDVTERKKAESQVAYMALHDPLTGLPNRTQFAERLGAALTSIGRGRQLAVLFLDLDHFKHVNDTLGHLVGDELLKITAERLRSCVRETDMVARLGGDEFAIIQTAIDSPNDVVNLAQRIQALVKAPYDLGNFQAVVDVSIGISLAPSDAIEPAELMRRADLALYKAKADGRGTWRFFEPDMDARMKARRQLELDLRAALANGELELFYQPVVTLNGNHIAGLEALLRWHHPERGMILPGEFIPIAEETGLIIPLGEWVIRRACADAIHWPQGTRIAVNLSPVQFRSTNLTQVVTSSLAASGVAASQLELEITEEVLLTHNRENLATLEQLRALGVRIVMDDFGTGYSSLNYLRRFPFDKIKIDRSFINDLTRGSVTSLAIVEAVAKLAKTADMSSTAEGIETKEQLEIVRALGCTEYQGYLFSPPKSVAAIARLFRPLARSKVTAA
jgi:diguanylate cyclase (GGDEF)-like protein/PAS domain S-box-containing protein